MAEILPCLDLAWETLTYEQICFAASRVLVQDSIAPKFIEAIKTAFENATLKMGDPSLEDTAFGPLADKKQFERVMSFLDGARTEGVQVLTGGSRKGDKGTFVSVMVSASALI